MTNVGSVTGKTAPRSLSCASANTANRLTTCFGYDSAGNMTSNGSVTYTYDDENRITATASYTYVYDGDGVRVKKSIGSTGTLYWTGTTSDALAESDLSGNINAEYMFFAGMRVARRDVPSNTVHFYMPDQLGSARQILTPSSATAVAVEESDYDPYGYEFVISGSDSNHYKFEGKERDTESNLDNFGARYFAFTIGRFMTPDWAARPTAVPYAVFGDPQSLNLYGYVRNDPVTSADLDGHEAARSWGAISCWLYGMLCPAQDSSAGTGSSAQNQSSGGFWQKLGNAISGNGWKTNDQVTADQRQWLSDNGTQRRDANGTTSVDWSKASSKDVTAAYNYIHQVMSAANTDHLLSMVGIPSAVTFGHGARHLAGSGLNQADVESAIHQDVDAGVKNATQSTGNFWGRVNVGGQTVEYRAFTLPNGTINVGTYYIP